MLDINNQSANNHPLTSPLTTNLISDPNILNLPAFNESQATTPQTIAFVDSNVNDAMTLIAGLEADVKVLLDPTRDGISQITETLGKYKDLTGISIISHGDDAQLQLGNSFLNENSLAQYTPALQQWKASLAPEADILIYGCKVAAKKTGKALIKDLSRLTGADIAASINLTGDRFQGGDWKLEYTTGSIETATPLTASLINTYRGLLDSFFTPTTTPVLTNLTDGVAYELGLKFTSAKAGQIQAIKYWKAPSETGTHVGKIWSSTGQVLASVTFTNETASGWQQQALTTPLTVAANTTYTVTVNSNSYYAGTVNGLANPIVSGDITTVGGVVANQNAQNVQLNSNNYFRDIVFVSSTPPPATNHPGTIAINGTATQNQTLTAAVTDTDGLTGVTVNYKWQQSSDNGSTWTDITGATGPSLTLGQSQVGKQVRATATYTDALGSSENITSTATGIVGNVNDSGIAAISGITAQGNILTATVTDADGVTGGSITYQWQKSSDNGSTWSDITGATNQTLTLDNSLVGKQLRVNALYTDVLGGSENIFSAATGSIATVLESVFAPTATPSVTNANLSSPYEVGLKFTSAKTGQIQAIKYWKAPSETGTHVGKIWSSTGQVLASVTFTNETASGWQQQTLTTPLTIAANTTYTVTVNANTYYAGTVNGLTTPIVNSDLTGVSGVYGTLNALPTQSYQNTNFYRDIVFAPTPPPASNHLGTIAINGIATQNQTLTAAVTDTDGLTGVTVNYKWQQSSDNGSTWTDITGATGPSLTLGQSQVGKQVRATAIYTDALGSSENITSTATDAVIDINDSGIVAISGITAQGNILTATVTDADGVTGGSITYQWQKSSDNGSTWSDITGATNQTLTLDNSLVGKQLRVSALYTDVLGGSENIFSAATGSIATVLESVFAPTATPVVTNMSDGVAYELGLKFTTAKTGEIQAIKYWKAPSETGTHVGKIWSSTGQVLASVTFTNETASGWQQQALTTPLTIAANTTYVVTVNSNSYYAGTASGLLNPIVSGDLTTVAGLIADGNAQNAQYNTNNYFRDIVFAPPTSANDNNHSGTIAINGTATEDQTLTAAVADADGLTGVNVSYQWQESSDNGVTWSDIAGATARNLVLEDARVGKQLRAFATYTDALGNRENIFSAATSAISNINDPGLSILRGSATVGQALTATVLDDDGLTGVTVNYQWQQLVNDEWIDIAGASGKTLSLDNSLLGKQVRLAATYTDAHNTLENVFSSQTNIAELNPIVLENQNPGTTSWKITNLATNDEIAGFAGAMSVNKGETLPIKVSLAQTGQYTIDVYRLGYYGGAGGRLMASSGLLNGYTQAGPTIDPTTRLVEYHWNTSYNLAIGNDWTTGEYVAKLTDINTGKESQVVFVVRDDNRPTDIGFQSTFNTFQAYNNYGGYSVYDISSLNAQPAYKVSFDRPFSNSPTIYDKMLFREYNGVRWLESQGYDISYYTNLEASINPLQLYSQNVFLDIGHDEYWTMEMRDNIEQARDNGINLAFLSANTAYWRVRYEPSTTGEANRVMVCYKDDWALDPVAQNDISAATTQFRNPVLNRPENGLLGVMYTGYGDINQPYQGFDFVPTNVTDPYYHACCLECGRLSLLVGGEWDTVVDNGFTPDGLVILSQSAVAPNGTGPYIPSGTNTTIANAVRYTALSGAKVFSVGSINWVWGLDSDGLPQDHTDSRAQQFTVNVLADMGAKPQTPDDHIVMPEPIA